jgi:hypothetical protein
MASMNREARRRIISALKELDQHEFDSVLSEVHQARGEALTGGACRHTGIVAPFVLGLDISRPGASGRAAARR